jgi:hypothetical protein
MPISSPRAQPRADRDRSLNRMTAVKPLSVRVRPCRRLARAYANEGMAEDIELNLARSVLPVRDRVGHSGKGVDLIAQSFK